MALQFPLIHQVFMDRIPVSGFRWLLVEQVEVSGATRGSELTKQVGDPFWQAEIRISPRISPAKGAEIDALSERIGATGTFYVYNRSLSGPILDRTGATLSDATPTIRSIGDDNRSIAVAGLPPGYILSAGDKFHVEYGNAPVRRAMCSIAETVAANGSGNTPEFQVSPWLRAGILEGLEVTLMRPGPIMKFDVGSYQPGISGKMFVAGGTFTAREAPQG